MNEQLQTTVNEILKTMQSAATEYGPQAFDLALRLKQIDGIQQIAWGVVGVLVLCWVGWVVKRTIRYYSPKPVSELTAAQIARRDQLAAKGYSDRTVLEDREFARLTGTHSETFDWMDHPELLATLFLIIPVCIGLDLADNLLNIWNWAAVFQPDLALAHDILTKLTTAK